MIAFVAEVPWQRFVGRSTSRYIQSKARERADPGDGGLTFSLSKLRCGARKGGITVPAWWWKSSGFPTSGLK